MSNEEDSIRRANKVAKVVDEDINKAEEYLEENNERDCINKLFWIYENCTNIVKDLKDHRPVSDHGLITRFLNTYYELGILKKDYSKTHKRLNNLRKQAAFDEYSAIKTKKAGVDEIRTMIYEAKELVKETKNLIKKETI